MQTYIIITIVSQCTAICFIAFKFPTIVMRITGTIVFVISKTVVIPGGIVITDLIILVIT